MAPDKTLLLAHKQRLTALWASILRYPLSCGNKHGEKIEKGQNQVKQCVTVSFISKCTVFISRWHIKYFERTGTGNNSGRKTS